MADLPNKGSCGAQGRFRVVARRAKGRLDRLAAKIKRHAARRVQGVQDRFAYLGNRWRDLPPTVIARPTIVHQGPEFYEGPWWDQKHKQLLIAAFSPAGQRILALDHRGARPWMTDTQGINGTCPGIDGHMLAAQAFGHRLLSICVERDGPGAINVVHEDPQLNQPNDVYESPTGTIYFVDPDFSRQKKGAIYMGKRGGPFIKLIAADFIPSGVQGSIDGKTLFISDCRSRTWRAYDIKLDGTLHNERAFRPPRSLSRRVPDGMTMDEVGNLYLTGFGGVWVYSPAKKPLGLIPTKTFASNVTFGGDDGRDLFITCSGQVLRVPMRVRGQNHASHNV